MSPSDTPQSKGSSNVSRLLATLSGVLADKLTGVFHGFCAGLGVMFTKSEKSKPWPGVLGNMLLPPGVTMADEGRPAFRWGGVEGGSILLRAPTAGDGEAAR